MSHYPTSAELAAFRRAIRPAWYAQDFTGHDLTGKEWPMAPLDHTPNRTTRTWGIPVRNGMLHVPTRARREASALRSRAYSTSMVHGPQSCYLCGQYDFHAYSCEWNINR